MLFDEELLYWQNCQLYGIHVPIQDSTTYYRPDAVTVIQAAT